MRLLYSLATAMLLSTSLPALHASAFTMDSTGGTTAEGSRFMDPDEQVHSFFFGGSGVNEDGWANRTPASRNLAPAPDATNQGIIFPNLFLPTAPRR